MEKYEKLEHDKFFKSTWLKKAALYNNLLTDYLEDLDKNELAGMAMENDFVSRIIRFPENDYKNCTVEYGPFSEKDLTQLSEDSAWSLLIQNTEEIFENIKNIQKYFDFIPQLFHDDVMAVISSNNGTSASH